MDFTKSKRIFLSPPHMGGEELRFVQEAFDSNYIAPLGPQVDAFECEFAEKVGVPYAVALSSGTAAMHLALRCLGVGPGDEVIASTLTFIGSVTPIVFQGATPVFIDSDRVTWNMDPDLLEEELDRCAAKGKLPKAVVPTDLYGQCCDYERIVEIGGKYGVPVVADAAEALGALFQKSEIRGQKSDGGREEAQMSETDLRSPTSGLWHHAGVGAKMAVFSFNGNKIITTSGGGMLASEDEALIEEARFLSQQARDQAPHYEHSQIGYNYRMSNILAAIGRGQLRVLDERVRRKREIFEYYKQALSDLPGIQFMPEPPWSRSNRWLTVILITPEEFGADRETVRLALEAENIEARPVWKPMHLQPVFQVEGLKAQGSRLKARENGPQITQINGRKEAQNTQNKKTYKAGVVGGEVAEDLFKRGLCLPSGTAMTDGDLDRVIETILICRKK
ncbi:MAG: aminotransferase class I/II-fold pyridoxal phosphate-dependent enzyme [Deltaproteobacteria bacterium]|nr:aminotransferase class I/II-fold pyridoxal phosphate-dependent enzyme [Deltaproteobacteria bacterium]